MVKRKSPIIPITIVVIGLSVAFAVNTQMHPKDPQEEAKAAQKQEDPGAVRPADKKEDLQQALVKTDAGPGKPGGPPQMKMGAKAGNLMTAEKPTKYHPKPSPTSTDAQWYKDR